MVCKWYTKVDIGRVVNLRDVARCTEKEGKNVHFHHLLIDNSTCKIDSKKQYEYSFYQKGPLSTFRGKSLPVKTST